MKPHHLLYAAGGQLVSHLELISTTVSVSDVGYRVASPTAVLTYPAFRGEGWSSRLNARAAELIDASGAEIGLLTCAPNLIDFYGRAGWTHAQGTPIIAGQTELHGHQRRAAHTADGPQQRSLSARHQGPPATNRR